MPIQKVHARQSFDSRGNPAIQVEVTTESGVFRAKVPNSHENKDCDAGYMVDSVKSKIAPALIGKDETDQQNIDKIMLDLDGTENKTILGADALLGVSLACCRAGAAEKDVPLLEHLNEIAGKRLTSAEDLRRSEGC